MILPALSLLTLALADPTFDPETVLQQRQQSCRNGGQGLQISLEIKVKNGRPRLLDSLPALDVGRYCDCVFERRRSEFGVQDTFDLITLSPDLRARLGDAGWVRLSERDGALELECVELGATGGLKYADPAEARFADLIDVCSGDPATYSLLAGLLLGTPGQVNRDAMSLDRGEQCACFYDAQRDEFGLEKALLFNSLFGSADTAARAEAERSNILTRKAEMFRACAGLPPLDEKQASSRSKPKAADRPSRSSSPSADDATEPGGRGRVVLVTTAVLLLAAALLTGLLVRRRQRAQTSRPYRGGRPPGPPRRR